MTLPVTPEYLAVALAEERKFDDMTVRQHWITKLQLPSGSLIACDPFVLSELTPLDVLLPRGTFPVVLSVAHCSNDQRVAFATIRFRESAPVAWDMLAFPGQDVATLADGHYFGYAVDSGTGCFIDASAARALARQMGADPGFFDRIVDEMNRTYVHTWSWLNLSIGDGNLVALSSGVGDGAYATYAGFDDRGKIAVVVTDFSVVAAEAT